MKATLTRAMLVASALVAPLLYLELRYASRNYAQGPLPPVVQFPIPLFIILWLIPVVSVLVAAPLMRAAHAGQNLLDRPVALAVRVAFLLIAALLWAGIVADQWPCFMGLPNCD